MEVLERVIRGGMALGGIESHQALQEVRERLGNLQGGLERDVATGHAISIERVEAGRLPGEFPAQEFSRDEPEGVEV